MPYPEPGGSVLVTYDANSNGFIRQYHLATSLIQSQLQQMYANGQRRLGLAVAYHGDGNDPFALDCSSGQMTTQDRANLIALVKYAASIGFLEFLVEMIPEWEQAYTNWQNPTVMGPTGCRAWQPLIYQNILSYTLAVDAAMASTGAFYRMNLLGECANADVASRLWFDWCAMKGGDGGSVGFSMVTSQQSIDNFPKFYTNGILPLVLAVSAYNNSATMDWPTWKAATASWYQAFIVGESLDNNPSADAMFADSPGRLFYRLVWPVSSNDPSAKWVSTASQRF